jgi:hypothetical protein
MISWFWQPQTFPLPFLRTHPAEFFASSFRSRPPCRATSVILHAGELDTSLTRKRRPLLRLRVRLGIKVPGLEYMLAPEGDPRLPHGSASSKGVGMKTTNLWMGAILCAGLTASVGHAQYIAPALHYPLLPAPDACGPGFYSTCPYGSTYGPNYCLRPSFPPVNGVPPPPWGVSAPMAGFPTHPYARGPRDYFMWTEVQRERITRERRPPLVP